MSKHATIRLPDIINKRCELLVVCGHFNVDDNVPLDGFSDKRTRTFAQYIRSGKTIRVSLVRDTPRRGRGAHLHIDFTRTKWGKYSDTIPAAEEVISSLQLQKLLSPLSGLKIEADVIGYFTASRDELPGAIRYAIAPAEADGVQLEMVEGTYNVRGAPIHSIRWRQSDTPDRVEIALASRTIMTLQDDYFELLLSTIESAFLVLFHTQ